MGLSAKGGPREKPAGDTVLNNLLADLARVKPGAIMGAMTKNPPDPILKPLARWERFLQARLRESELRYLEYLETLSPRDRAILAFPVRKS
jgi:hypothetical protein